MSKVKMNYSIGDAVTILKKGLCEGLPGKVLTNNTDTSFKPLNVILDNALGSWQFNYEDVEPINKEKSIKVDPHISEPETQNKVENLTVVTKPEKRKYQKRGAVKEVKAKRAYHKKVKS